MTNIADLLIILTFMIFGQNWIKWTSYIKGLMLEFYLSTRWGKQGIAQEPKDNRLKPTDGQQRTCSLLGLVVDGYGWDLN
jgi:hypothetical protein